VADVTAAPFVPGARVRVRRPLKTVGLLKGHEGVVLRTKGRKGRYDSRVVVQFPARTAAYVMNPFDLEIVSP